MRRPTAFWETVAQLFLNGTLTMRDLEGNEIEAGELPRGTHKVTRLRETICVADRRAVLGMTEPVGRQGVQAGISFLISKTAR